MVIINDSSDFIKCNVKVITINSTEEIGRLIVIEENGILLKRHNSDITVYLPIRNIISMENVPSMDLPSYQKKDEEKDDETDKLLKNADMDRVHQLIRCDIIETIIDDSDYDVDINDDGDINISYSGDDIADISDNEMTVYDEDFISIAKEIAEKLHLSINRDYEE